ncbi:transcription factor 25 [Cimex lectularius]|uniref:Transcription factor 25 n=1 Tax=Cimex lectularius TaxID=79782 RepID=A0A8I6SDB6_CIMLE|nr:transcription factor 25 [Cimex lectularius]
MSSRVLRKLGLQGEKELSCLGDDGGSDTEADFSTSSNTKKKQLNINRYDLLNQLSHSESEVKEDDDHETAGSLNAQEGAIDVKDASRRKKKKKKKKPCKIPSSNTRSSEDNIEDEVEKSVREVNALLGEIQGVGPVQSSDVQIPSSARKGVLSVDHRMLNPNNELRRIFGAKIIQSEQMKKRGRGSRGHLKTTWLVSPKDYWYQIEKPGLSMKLVETKNGVQYFSYEHSLSYQEVQMRFLDAVESLNPEFIMRIINSHPYHVDALLQLSDICKLSEDLSMATELVQRALYCLECAFHPSFSVASGNCRLDYRKQENRSLYIALFKHMMYIGSRACYRTSLEFCKLILSLDPEGDPLAVVLVMDFYALRSQEYKWLLRIANEWEATRNLSQLPNIAYSVAVAHFQLGDLETAHLLLQKAVMMFPGVVLPLAEKCSVQVDTKISSSQFFTGATERQSKSLTQLELLYVARSYHIWKEPELLAWLERNVHQVMERVEADDPFVLEWEQNRQKRYPSTPRNVLRHIILSDIKDLPLLTNEDFQISMFNFDPLPPTDSINLYTRPMRTRAYENDSTLSIFIRSLMPNFNINQVASDETGEDGGEGSGVDLRRSVTSLLDAMRDLLSNIHLPDVPGDGDVEDDPDTDT